jgi:hypothetical protein
VVVVDFESLEEVRDVLKPQDTRIHKDFRRRAGHAIPLKPEERSEGSVKG